MLDKITKAVSCAMIPCLDKDFVPATLWDREFRKAVNASGKSKDIVIAVERNSESVSIYPTVVFDNADASEMAANVRHVERLVKGLLWMRGGWKVTIAGDAKIAEELAKIYSPEGERSFDYAMMGRIYSNRMQIVSCAYADAPKAKEPSMPLGRHLDGCRIGFDLGGSDRKCAATIDGKLVFSEEVPWDPYFEKDPQYHRDGINDTLKRAAAHLPRVDAIGGSSAGVYVNNRVRLASLFRGVPEDQFETKVKDLFIELGKEWGVPFEVVNDGEVTALAGSMEMNANCVLGISMGTSVAGGYVNREGNITDWLNELAFVPVDYREGAPADEWSGDLGCAVQYFCQQGVARLVPLAGIELPKDMKFAEQLKEVQKLMEAGDERAAKAVIYKGDAYSKLGKRNQAKKEYEKVLRSPAWRGEAHAEALYKLGEMSQAQNKIDDALMYYDRCALGFANCYNWTGKAVLASAKLLSGQGKNPEAKAMCVEFLNNASNKKSPEYSEIQLLNETL